MGRKKTTQTVLHKQIVPQDTKDITAWRNHIQNADFSSPVINTFGQLDKQIGDEYLPEDLTDESRSRIRSAKLFKNKMDRGMALSDAEAREHQYKTGAMASLAAGTAPQIVTAGGTQTSSGGFLGDYLLASAGGAAA